MEKVVTLGNYYPRAGYKINMIEIEPDQYNSPNIIQITEIMVKSKKSVER